MAHTKTYSVERRVGRLVEARLHVPNRVAEVAAMVEELRRVFATARSTCVICADWRSATLLAPDVADALVNMLRRGNPHVERSGVLLTADDALFNLQVERVTRKASGAVRRTFRSPAPMTTWLGEILDEAERSRMGEFLAAAK
jgi:hypothetical protein